MKIRIQAAEMKCLMGIKVVTLRTITGMERNQERTNIVELNDYFESYNLKWKEPCLMDIYVRN